MILQIIGKSSHPIVSLFGILFAFGLTYVALLAGSSFLPKDHGREFAHQGALSAGKPRGAGIIFIFSFVFVGLIFGHMTWENFFYLVFIVAEMFSGYFDDAAAVSWGRLKKGLLDLGVAVGVTVVYMVCNGSSILLPLSGHLVNIPGAVFFLFSVLLIFVSINVVNCTDGVDGLSGTLSIISLSTFLALGLSGLVPLKVTTGSESFSTFIILFIAVLLAYLWFNATPSLLMMGDSGSRAMGLILAIAALTSGCPLVFIPAALLMILDGGLGLVKLTLYKTIDTKKRFMHNIRLPLHDHVRKTLGWSNAQTVFRFAIIQIMVSAVFIYMVLAA